MKIIITERQKKFISEDEDIEFLIKKKIAKKVLNKKFGNLSIPVSISLNLVKLKALKRFETTTFQVFFVGTNAGGTLKSCETGKTRG